MSSHLWRARRPPPRSRLFQAARNDRLILGRAGKVLIVVPGAPMARVPTEAGVGMAIERPLSGRVL
jgi:hypothetical protein